MEYFKKVQCFKPNIGIIDAPIRIEEVALLQNSVDKNMLGRIKFVNQSTKSVIAIFVKIKVQNIAGEDISLKEERYIYQDMCILPGDLYGNKIAINLPTDARKFNVALEKIVFEDGSIWNADKAESCVPIPQEVIDIPYKYFDTFKKIISQKIDNIDYVKYCYEEGETFWECSCGKINSINKQFCSFCSVDRQVQKELLSKKEIDNRILEIKTEIQREQEEQAKIKQKEQEQKEEQKRIRDLEYQKKKELWDKEEREREEKRQQEERIKRKKRKIKNIILIAAMLVAFLGVLLYFSTREGNNAKLEDSQIIGLDENFLFYPGLFYEFQVVGAGTDNNNPRIRDVKWEPIYWSPYSNPSQEQKFTSWRIGNENGIFEEKTFNIYVFFQKYEFNGYEWIKNDTIESLTVPIKCRRLDKIGSDKDNSAIEGDVNNKEFSVEDIEKYIGKNINELISFCGKPDGYEYEDNMGFYYYPSFTVSTTVDEDGNEIVAGVW